MTFTKIDTEHWERKEYFTHYFEHIPCTYSMTVKLDMTRLKKSGRKLYPTLIYGVMTVVNRHEEFRTAVNEAGEIGVFSDVMPCYTVFHKDTEAFSNIWTEYSADYHEFLSRFDDDMSLYGAQRGMMAKPDPPPNTIPISMIPWVTFEGFHLNLQRGYDYLLPIFTFGKYGEVNGKYEIPLSVQVHHAVCDGFHISRFFNELQDLINHI